MSAPPPEQVYTVSQLARGIGDTLSRAFGTVWVKGELSNFRAYGSGHWYFTLKDRDCQLKGAMFARENRRVRFRPGDGDEVVVRGRVDLYAARGDLQIVAAEMMPVGAGRLQAEFEALKAKLAAEGLFDDARKKPLPVVPRRIGIVTSPQAAALQDMLRVLETRDSSLSITLSPTAVQGAHAGKSIAKALRLLDRAGDVEVILCGRGGGSLEDLWAFNEEVVARAIAECRTPVVSGVGHEIDFTIADFVADLRAPTPTAAAEAAVPRRADLEAAVESLHDRLRVASTRALDRKQQRVDELRRRLVDPRRRLARDTERLATARGRLDRLALDAVDRRRRAAAQASTRLGPAAVRAIRSRREAVAGLHRALGVLGPLATLERGWALTTGPDDQLLRDANAVQVGDAVRVRLSRGALGCRVEEILGGEDVDLRGRRQS